MRTILRARALRRELSRDQRHRSDKEGSPHA